MKPYYQILIIAIILLIVCGVMTLVTYKALETSAPAVPAEQNSGDLVWFEVPEHNIKVQVTEQTKTSYEQLVESLRKDNEQLVWYEIPEMNIRFLVTTDTKRDLRYVTGESFINGKKYVDSIEFYYQTIADVAGCDIKSMDEDYYKGENASCSTFAISGIQIDEVQEYEALKKRSFCGTAYQSIEIEDSKFCLVYGKDYIPGLDKDIQDKISAIYKSNIYRVLPETLKSTN